MSDLLDSSVKKRNKINILNYDMIFKIKFLFFNKSKIYGRFKKNTEIIKQFLCYYIFP